MPDPGSRQVSGARRTPSSDRGAALVPLIVATGVLLLVISAVVNLVVFQYGKGVVRSALDEGAPVEQASRSTTGTFECEARANNVLSDLLGGQMGTGVHVACVDDGTRMIATATVHFDGWFGSVTDYDTTLVAPATRETRRDDRDPPRSIPLAVGLLLLPVVIVVLSIPPWPERQSIATSAACASSLLYATAPNAAAGAAIADDAVHQTANNYGIDNLTLELTGEWCRGCEVTARVTVTIPAIRVPFAGTVGSFEWTATSTARIDDYRSISPSDAP
ncbi:MAG: hypothetical protein R2715_16750 [Ilumatobacteraceae bacterium]